MFKIYLSLCIIQTKMEIPETGLAFFQTGYQYIQADFKHIKISILNTKCRAAYENIPLT